MGGFGSGREGSRPVAEQSLSLPIKVFRSTLAALAERLHQPNVERATASSSLDWKRYGGYVVASTGYDLIADSGCYSLVLLYTYRGEPVRDEVQLVSTPCNYGGGRWWYRCPWCLRRVGVLFAPGRLWRCRHCYRITYESCNDSHKYDHLFRRMGVDPSIQKYLFR